MAKEHKDQIVNNKNNNNPDDKRVWHITHIDKSRLKGNQDFNISITTSTRTEHPTTGVPEKLYSSLKYDQIHQIMGPIINQFAFLIVKVHVIDPETGEEVKMVNKPILKGTTEASVTPQGNNSNIEAKLRWQFTGCSYHHQRKHFAFVASYYTPQELQKPLFTLISSPFLVYARKPTPTDPQAKAKPRGIHKKRMRDSMEQQKSHGEEPPYKVPKTEDICPIKPSNLDLLQLFRNKVEELANLKQQLTPEQQNEATQLIYQYLIPSDPHFNSLFNLPPVWSDAPLLSDGLLSPEFPSLQDNGYRQFYQQQPQQPQEPSSSSPTVASSPDIHFNSDSLL